MQLNPYISFNGCCEAAFKFYERCLGGKIETMMPHTGTPAEQQVSAEWGNKILHASMNINGQTLMGMDAPPERYEQPNGFQLSIQVDNIADAERIFRDLGTGGKICMPLEKTFWAERFGMLVDQFGIPWMINCLQAA